jgi:hypothetical protein
MLDQALVDKECSSGTSMSISTNSSEKASADMKQYAGAKFSVLSNMIRGKDNKLYAYAEDVGNEEARNAWVGPIVLSFIVPMVLCVLLSVWWIVYCIASCCCCKPEDAL